MGRLIDADKLRKQMSEDYAQGLSKISNPTVKAIVEKAVETFDGYVVSAETVDAISVDWIEKYIEEVDEIGFCPEAMHVSTMMSKWKEQNNGQTD